MKIFFSGGCKNGKSTLAEETSARLCKNGRLYYIATMQPHDDEDYLRIERHRSARAGRGFTTIEHGTAPGLLAKAADPQGTYLLDSVTALLSNEMFFTRDGKTFGFDPDAPKRVADALMDLSKKTANIVVVSDYIFSGSKRDEFTESYREGLALCHRQIAEAFDTVCEVCLGNINIYKGELPK